MALLNDAYGRSFNTLRISLITSCNLGCIYCVDPLQKKHAASAKALTNEKFIGTVSTLHSLLHFSSIRLTGGEPTLYKNLIPLITGLKKLNIPEIKMTTNGHLLEKHAMDYKQAGLTSTNISLDALDPEVFYAINKRHALQQTLDGIEAAMAAGLKVKINCVLMKAVNENQILKIFSYCKERNIPLRFLELMQMGHLHHNYKEHFFSEQEILTLLAAAYTFIEAGRQAHATAKYWTTGDGYSFGIISNVSDPFCTDCNRLRLDSYGNIFGCLSDNTAVNIQDCLQDEIALKRKLAEALAQKKMQFTGSLLSMQDIGG
jgi:cyclic pyranopterin phosphate synthase